MSCPSTEETNPATPPLEPVAKIGERTFVRLGRTVDTAAWAPVMREFIVGRADKIGDEIVVVIGYPKKELRILRNYLLPFGLMLASHNYFSSLVAIDPDHVKNVRVFLYSEEVDISQLIPHLS